MAASDAMPAARSATLRRASPRSGKPGFAKRVRDFANRAAPKRPVPGFPLLWIGCAAAAGLMIVTGGFGTGDLPLGQRSFFWLLLLGWSALKWQALFAWRVRKPSDWPRAALIGAIPLNLPLPIEIALCARIVGAPMTGNPADVWGRALAISVVIFAACSLVAWVVLRRNPESAQAAESSPAVRPGSLLDRARVAPEALAAIEAEDHYCRVRRTDGGSALLHYRFGDAVGDVAGIEGAQVHRGTWVAAAAVLGARREGRRWLLLLADGGSVAVSAAHVAEARRRGWLRAPAR